MPYHSSPYREELPRWVTITGIALLFIAQYFISGLNGDVGPRVTSYFGLDSSKVSFYLHISTVGLVAVLPMSYRFRAYFRRTSLLIGIMGLQCLISIICIFTNNEIILLISSFLMGALKIICIIDFLSLLFDLFPFLKERGLFYGLFYCFSRIMGEISTYSSLTLIDEYDWRIVFKVSAAAAAVSIPITLALFQRERLQRKVPLYQVDWISMLLMIIAGFSLCYTLTMGMEKNWFAAPEIVNASIIFVLSTLVFIYRQYQIKRPFWDLRVFKLYKQVPLGFALMFLMYMFYSTSYLYSVFIDYDFKNQENYLANIAYIHIISYAICFPLAGLLVYKGYSKRLLLCIGYMCFAFSLFYFYNIIQTNLTYWDLVPPLALQSIGYAFTLTTSAAFMATNIPREHNKDRVMGSISARYIFGSFIGYSLFSNWLFRGSAQNSADLSENLTVTNPNFMSEFNNLSHGFASKGADIQLAQQKALFVIQQKLDIQAMIITIRDISFVMGILAIITAIAVLFIRRLEMHKIEGVNRYSIIPW